MTASRIKIRLTSVNSFLPRFCLKVIDPLFIWASETFVGKLRPNGWLETAQWLQWRAYHHPSFEWYHRWLHTSSPFLEIGVLNAPQPGPTSRRVLPPGKYDRRYRQDMCCARCHYEPSDVVSCQITLVLVIHKDQSIDQLCWAICTLLHFTAILRSECC